LSALYPLLTHSHHLQHLDANLLLSIQSGYQLGLDRFLFDHATTLNDDRENGECRDTRFTRMPSRVAYSFIQSSVRP
jgi:hypothetical protein